MPSMKNQITSDPHSANGVHACGQSEHEGAGATDSPNAKPSKLYWRSVDDLADTPEFRQFMHREFPAGASEMLDSGDRRQFLKLMGASMALAGLGLAGCRRWPDEKIAPYANRPAGHAPGTTDQFATCMEIGGIAAGLLVTSYDYRPIKVEGNPQHPTNKGATDACMQASVLDLYDPDRSRSVLHNGKTSDWTAFTAWAKNAGGNGLAVLCEATNSPSMQSMKQRLLKAFPNATWHEYEPLNNDNEVKGSLLAFGSPHRAHYAFDKARTIVALDSDFLHCGPQSIKWMREFAQARSAEGGKSMNRLYAFEPTPTITGTNADHRVAVRSADVAIIAARIAAAIVPGAADQLSQIAAAKLSSAVDAAALDNTLHHLIEDLRAAQGASIVVAGPRQPAEVHYLAHLINEALANIGQTVTYTAQPEAIAHVESLQALANRMDAGQVQTLVIIGGNPVYNAPADLKFADLLKKVPASVHLSEYVDETSLLCTWHVNRAHYLETWGDGRAYDGTITLGQPLIEALFQGKSAIEVLAAISGDELTNGLDIVRRTIREMGSGMDFDAFWRNALHEGFIAETQSKPANPRVATQNLAAVASKPQTPAGAADQLELVFTAASTLYDGRFANNGWLQELPDPMSKLTWDNALLMSPSAAKSRGLKTGSMVRINANGQQIDAAVMVLPGQSSGSIALALGYGREFAGRVCHGAGFNAYRLRTAGAMGYSVGATVQDAGDTYVLATTQDHHAADTVGGKGTQERLPTLFREANLKEYQEHPDFAKHRTHVVHRLSLWEEDLPFQSEDGRAGRYAWAMSIDLNACTGCSACVVACQAENNIPIVGKDQVKRGREMHWIRIDRYFKGFNEDSPDGFVHAPVTCNHCENAPCEQVCPVAATTHDQDGLNVMVYNRCVGTRYCSNNCPYKVRKFNYFDYHVRGPLREQPGMLLQVEPDYYTKGQAAADPLKQLQFNPEVTVRMRGIMEKCTYCIQRISKARVDAKNQWVKAKNLDPNAPLDARVPIADGAITPACAQACPAQAIVFGDLNDPTSRVAKLHKHERSYEMLEELNTKPRTRYLAKLRNPAFGESSSHSHG